MGQSIGRCEPRYVVVVIRPQMPGIKAADFQDRHMAVHKRQKAAPSAPAEIKATLAKLREAR